MTDIVDTKTRSRMMSGIKGKNTAMELRIRKALFRRGFRYRIHGPKLPGRPDMVFPKYNAVILVNGCFWHGHDCHLFKWPKTRVEFWKDKIEGNRKRDIRNISELQEMGYRVLTIWECAIRGRSEQNFNSIIDDIDEWLGHSCASSSIP